MDETSQDNQSATANDSINLKDPQVDQSANTDSGNVESPKTQSSKASDTMDWKDLEVLKFPKWYTEEGKDEKSGNLWNRIFGKRARYEEYLISQLRSTYMDLEGDLRTLIPEYAGITSEKEREDLNEIGNHIIHLLDSAKGILENQKLTKRRMFIATSLLNEIEECLVWITPPVLALAQIPALRSKIAQFEIPDKKDDEKYSSMLDECKKILTESRDKFEDIKGPKTEYYRARLEEIIRFANIETFKEKINTGLQIERLRTLRYWGMALLLFFILIFPFVANNNQWIAFPTSISWDGHQLLMAWVFAISFSVIGGIGGFLSGLLQVRSSQTNLGDFEISVLLFQLRPLFGAFAALILVVLMSWGVLSDVIVGSQGSYILVAFVSGFSERYFIKILKLNVEENASDTAIKQAKEIEKIKQGDATKPNGDGE